MTVAWETLVIFDVLSEEMEDDKVMIGIVLLLIFIVIIEQTSIKSV